MCIRFDSILDCVDGEVAHGVQITNANSDGGGGVCDHPGDRPRRQVRMFVILWDACARMLVRRHAPCLYDNWTVERIDHKNIQGGARRPRRGPCRVSPAAAGPGLSEGGSGYMYLCGERMGKAGRGRKWMGVEAPV